MKRLCALLLAPTLALAGEYHQLFTAGGEADSFLESNWNKYQENYHPNYAFDGNPGTAWVEGADGNGEGQELRWEVSKLETANRIKLRIRNGYQKSASLLRANGSVKDATLKVYGKRAEFVQSFPFTLKAQMGWQEFEFTLPENNGVTSLGLVVNSVTEGKTYKDTCVSDVETYVDSQVPYNAAIEKKKHEQLKTWIKERLKAAKFFAQTPVSFPFASTRFVEVGPKEYYPEKYREDYRGQPSALFYKKDFPENFSHPAEFKEAEGLRKKYAVSKGAKGGWQRLVVDQSRVPSFSPDGFKAYFFNQSEPTNNFKDVIMRYMTLDALSFFEAKEEIARTHKEPLWGAKGLLTVSNYQVHKEDDQIRAIAFWAKSQGEERGPFETNYSYVFVYEGKRLQWAIADEHYYRFTYNPAGKVTEILHIGHNNPNDFDSGNYTSVAYRAVLR